MAEDKKTGKPANLDVVRDEARRTADRISQEVDDSGVSSPSTEEQIKALRVELVRIKEALSHVAEGTGQLAVTQANTIRDELEEAVIRRPFTALVGAALVGYFLGTRLR